MSAWHNFSYPEDDNFFEEYSGSEQQKWDYLEWESQL
jgi:hypothetical protein